MEFFNILSDSVKILTLLVVNKGPRVLGPCWEGGGSSLASVDNHDLV